MCVSISVFVCDVIFPSQNWQSLFIYFRLQLVAKLRINYSVQTVRCHVQPFRQAHFGFDDNTGLGFRNGTNPQPGYAVLVHRNIHTPVRLLDGHGRPLPGVTGGVLILICSVPIVGHREGYDGAS